MIDAADRRAIEILKDRIDLLATGEVPTDFGRFQAIKMMASAIRHLAYPDRDTYPKVRGSKKGDPIVSRHRS